MGIDPGVFEARYAGLETSLDALKNSNHFAELPADDLKLLEEVLEKLRAFGAKHFEYFAKNDPSINLDFDKIDLSQALVNFLNLFEKHPEYLPKDFARGIAVGRISTDLHVIEQVISQRLLYPADTPRGKVLKKAQDLCYNILNRIAPDIFGDNPPKGLNPNTLPVVFTYFQKGSRARIMPYAPNVAFIGIPDTCISTPQDYLATAHELGHYLYWLTFRQGMMENPQIKAIAQSGKNGNQPEDNSWAAYWLEELVADACMLLAAGPIAALDFQDIENCVVGKGFGEDDGKHPPPVLRPYFHIDMLKTIDECSPTTRFGDAIIILNERWFDYFKQLETVNVMASYAENDATLFAEIQNQLPWYKIQAWKHKYEDPPQAPMTCKTMYDKSKVLVDHVIEQLQVMAPSFFAGDTWSALLNTAGAPPDTTEWYGKFKTYADQLALPAGLTISSSVVEVSWDTWRAALENRLQSHTGLMPGSEEYKTALWLKLLLAEGWTGPGPHAVPQPPEP
jgi:hypothetical protein